MIRLALLRHGHTAWNRAGRIQGRTDIPLDPDAKADLSKLMLPADWQGATLYASPLLRAVQTAQIVAGQAPRTDPALIEMNWGEWEGLQGRDLRMDPTSGYRDIEAWGWHYTPPDGEPLTALRARLMPWVTGLQSDTIAVCHIGVMRVLLAIATGWNFEGAAPFQVKRNRLFVIEVDADAWRFDPEPIRLEVRR